MLYTQPLWGTGWSCMKTTLMFLEATPPITQRPPTRLHPLKALPPPDTTTVGTKASMHVSSGTLKPHLRHQDTVPNTKPTSIYRATIICQSPSSFKPIMIDTCNNFVTVCTYNNPLPTAKKQGSWLGTKIARHLPWVSWPASDSLTVMCCIRLSPNSALCLIRRREWERAVSEGEQ